VGPQSSWDSTHAPIKPTDKTISRSTRSGCAKAKPQAKPAPKSWPTTVTLPMDRASSTAASAGVTTVWKLYMATSVGLSDLPSPGRSGAMVR